MNTKDKINADNELDAWIAEYVMGWRKVEGVLDVAGQCFIVRVDGVRFTNSPLREIFFRPTTDPADAMKVLKKCLNDQRELCFGDPFISKDGADYWIRTVRHHQHVEGGATTIELAICLFARKLYSK